MDYAKIENELKNLTWRQEQVLRLRFGIDDGNKRTYKEIADMFQLSPQRIEQIKNDALSDELWNLIKDHEFGK